VFGLSFGELCVLLLVAVVVLGPKELPRYLRKAGLLAGQLRRMAFDMRQKSGIDEVFRTEGIDRDIAEIRRLARGEIGGVVAAVRSTADAARARPTNGQGAPLAQVNGEAASAAIQVGAAVERLREYPPEGPDTYGALPDTATVYDSLPPSPLGTDPLYTRGEVEDGASRASPEPGQDADQSREAKGGEEASSGTVA
jgi:sec-independent protein translocase protein TatB